MNIFEALAKAQAHGEQMRIETNGATKLRYALPAHEDHICVHVKDSIVTRTS